jgi:hypothetical protein
VSLTAQVLQLFAEADLQLWAFAWALDHRAEGAWPAHLRVDGLPRA